METPYGVSDLRPRRQVTDTTVACHVDGCPTVVERQRSRFRAVDHFLCPRHDIYLSPSTFQYRDPWRNLLWRDPADRALMARIARVKRTTDRLGRERDEDALTWNVVRAFHREARLHRLAEMLLAGRELEPPQGQEPQVFYWSADARGTRWSDLQEAQVEFGEVPSRGTEVDLALHWRGSLVVFVEAKFCARNRTRPSPRRGGRDHRPFAYGRHPHFAAAFRAGYEEIAIANQRYELMRMWLLGSWLAEQEGAAFALVNLVRRGEEIDIEAECGERFCCQKHDRIFVRETWEAIWEALPSSGLADDTAGTLDAFFRNKSCGYGAGGHLQKAFKRGS